MFSKHFVTAVRHRGAGGGDMDSSGEAAVRVPPHQCHLRAYSLGADRGGLPGVHGHGDRVPGGAPREQVPAARGKSLEIHDAFLAFVIDNT